jgi:hypothetical protein
MKKIIALGVLMSVVLVAFLYAQESSLRKAFLHHQQQEYPEVKAYYPVIGGESFVMTERWKNYQKYAKKCPAIAEVVSVELRKTTDGGEWVITMRGPNSGKEGKDGFEIDTCSLWVKGIAVNERLEVRDFTDY